MGQFEALRAQVQREQPRLLPQTRDGVRDAFAAEVLPLYLQGEWTFAKRPLVLPGSDFVRSTAAQLPHLRFDPPTSHEPSVTSTYDHLTCFRQKGKNGPASFRSMVGVAQPYTDRNLVSLDADWLVIPLTEAGHDFYWPGSTRGFLVTHRMHLRPEIAQAA